MLKSGVDAKEASKLGVAARAAQPKRESTQAGDAIRYLRVPMNAAAVVRRLAAEAQRGSTHASRELRAWLDVLETDVPVSTSDLDAKTRQRLLTRLLAEIRAEDEGATPPTEPDPSSSPAGRPTRHTEAVYGPGPVGMGLRPSDT